MIKLNVDIKEQKENECLSECLRAVFSYYEIDISEEKIIEKISTDSFKLYDWEFKAGNLAIDKGLKAEIYSNVTQLFDPSWFKLSRDELIVKVEEELVFFKYRNDNFEKDPELASHLCPHKEVAERLIKDAKALLVFLKSGGVINFRPISKELIVQKLENDIPVIILHNATLLHRMQRFDKDKSDDIKGLDWGHVAIISGENDNHFLISDPLGIFYEKKMVYEADKDMVVESIQRFNGQLLVVSK